MILKPFDNTKINNAKTEAERRGYENEKQASYLIDFEYKDLDRTIVLHDVKFVYNGRTAQIDHLIIGHSFVFVIESKYFGGTLDIEEDEWVVDYGKTKLSIPSPVKQNERHIKVLRDIFKNEPIFPADRHKPALINTVLISSKTIVTGKKPPELIRADSFKDWETNAKIKWVAQNPLKVILSKGLMSSDELLASTNRLLRFSTCSYGSQESRVINERDNGGVEMPVAAQLNRKKSPNERHSGVDMKLIESLKLLRNDLARQNKVKMLHHVFDNRTLEDFATKRPKTKEDMLKISGVGEIKFERYGSQFLEILTIWEEKTKK